VVLHHFNFQLKHNTDDNLGTCTLERTHDKERAYIERRPSTRLRLKCSCDLTPFKIVIKRDSHAESRHLQLK
jgi:hypothetical protein